MELYQLKSLVAVAEESNLTRAAERLFTSQPAVSAHIKALESELGLSLFDRTSRGMIITRAGEQILEYAKGVLEQAQSLSDRARNLQAEPSGPLRMGLLLTTNIIPMDEISSNLLEKYPEIRLELMHGSSGSLIKGVLNGDLDAAIVEDSDPSPLLYTLPVSVHEVLLVGATSFAQAFEAKDWKDLEQLPWVFKTPECSYFRLMKRISTAHDLSLNCRYVIDHEGTCLQLAKKGIAISIVEKSAVTDDIAQGSLIAWPHFVGKLNVQVICLAKRKQELVIDSLLRETNSAYKQSAN